MELLYARAHHFVASINFRILAGFRKDNTSSQSPTGMLRADIAVFARTGTGISPAAKRSRAFNRFLDRAVECVVAGSDAARPIVQRGCAAGDDVAPPD